MRTQDLSECGYGCGAVDADEGVFSGVKALGFSSLNRRRYLPEAARAALPLYEGAKVFLNHPDDPSQTRRVEDLFGVLEGARVEEGGVFADIRANKAHPAYPQIAWLAANMPGAFGMSHNAVGQGRDEEGVFVVEKILEVRSVDVVSSPATTKGLRESSIYLGGRARRIVGRDGLTPSQRIARRRKANRIKGMSDAELIATLEGRDFPSRRGRLSDAQALAILTGKRR
jgi:hypothetical protein